MAKFRVTVTVTYIGEVEAESYEEAEAIGWNWEDELHYDGVDSIEVDELDEDDEEENLEILLHDAELEDEDE